VIGWSEEMTMRIQRAMVWAGAIAKWTAWQQCPVGSRLGGLKVGSPRCSWISFCLIMIITTGSGAVDDHFFGIIYMSYIFVSKCVNLSDVIIYKIYCLVYYLFRLNCECH
jgi:hypothetical protein